MKVTRCAVALMLLVLVFPRLATNLSALTVAVAVQQTEAAQEEFVPIDELPPDEQLPAAPLLIAAYVFVWGALIVYLWFLWRRLGKVEQELADLARRTVREGRR